MVFLNKCPIILWCLILHQQLGEQTDHLNNNKWDNNSSSSWCYNINIFLWQWNQTDVIITQTEPLETTKTKTYEIIQDEKVAEYSLGLTSFFFPEWLECQLCSHLINFFTLLRSPCCPMMCFVDTGLYLSAHSEWRWKVVFLALRGDSEISWVSRTNTKQTQT